ncbi:hypothetical protein BCR33DRAFT_755006 [Rhizoclosmatium globosum]|uniref:GPN-loop GTPase n=1 Tax=Rhizoclosmatium globosum TaxID=329046 RepID=A0A1Y2BH73_9FUNG|nr:hypothetical protein BCR33DRAFT_755006 [Rhizoclosmatium globosum]|eukprot:ORY33847.1 hypothetical protein BCR33DRAFT_755006 [Rhizoclosmatium globosum]
MAGSGKSTFMQRLTSSIHSAKKTPYVVNLDPAVGKLPFGCNIDIQDVVNYKQVMKQYGLGPNGGIITSLNLFTTKFDQVLDLISKRSKDLDYVVFDTPGQIEIFTWSASGQIITDTLASMHPTVLAYVIDTPRSTSPATFVSNMMYALSILYKTKLPMILVFNKCDVVDAGFAKEWMTDFESFQAAVREDEDSGYMSSLVGSMGLVLEEFYNALKVVSVSAVTGQGMDEFFVAVDEAVKEYHTDYRPAMEKKLLDKKEALKKSRDENLAKLMNDMAVDGGGKEVKSGKKADEDDFYADDGADEDEELNMRFEDRSTNSRAEDESFQRFIRSQK